MQNDELQESVKKLSIGSLKRHIFLCTHDTCSGNVDKSKDVWTYLKKRLSELQENAPQFFRTQAHCLRVCKRGPIAVVYPEGTWYANVDIENCEKIIQEHLLKGKIVEDLCFAKDSLGND